MNIDQLRERVPDEASCRELFEELIWPNGRICPHCDCEKSYKLTGKTSRPGLYECSRCKHQFTVTTRTPMHSTKLPLWKWLLALYYAINSSKGVSSVYIARLVGVRQPTAWKIGHAIRKMIDAWKLDLPRLSGIIEADEKFFGGRPRFRFGETNRRNKYTKKQRILVAVERGGSLRAEPIDSFNTETVAALIEQFTDKQASFMTDKDPVFHGVGRQFASHQTVLHSAKEYARDDVHINTVEAFNSVLERTKAGVFHYMSKDHTFRYLDEIAFRWVNKNPKEIFTNRGKRKTIWTPKPVLDQLKRLMSYARGSQIRRSKLGGIRDIAFQPSKPSFGG